MTELYIEIHPKSDKYENFEDSMALTTEHTICTVYTQHTEIKFWHNIRHIFKGAMLYNDKLTFGAVTAIFNMTNFATS